jgi:hypothetical protein
VIQHFREGPRLACAAFRAFGAAERREQFRLDAAERLPCLAQLAAQVRDELRVLHRYGQTLGPVDVIAEPDTNIV